LNQDYKFQNIRTNLKKKRIRDSRIKVTDKK